MKLFTIIVLCSLVFACASFPPVDNLGSGLYSLKASSPQKGPKARQLAISYANKYCAENNQNASIENIEEKPSSSTGVGIEGASTYTVTHAVAVITFRCN